MVETTVLIWFQSLFYWIINSIANSPTAFAEIFPRFQSLFYWIINSILENLILKLSEDKSFNPYSTGLSILSIADNADRII